MAAVNGPHLVATGPQRPHLVLVPAHRPRPRPQRPDPATVARRRLVVLAGLAFFVCLALVLVQRLDTAGVPTGTPSPTERIGHAVHVVQPGETLWDIAEAVAPDADPRVVVALLVEHNGDAPLQVGQRLVLPS